MASYQDLKAWQLSMDLMVRLYAVTHRFPSDEKFGIVAQIRRAAVSIPCNISEGYARRTRGEYLNSLSVALGSQSELETLLIAAQRLNYLDSAEYLGQCIAAGKVLRALLSSLERRPPRSTLNSVP